jgi:hypothetical protein
VNTPKTDQFLTREHVAHDATWIDFARELKRDAARYAWLRDKCADVDIRAGLAWKEGVASFAAWLVDNAEGKTITEELLMEWGTRCIRESDPLRDILENAQIQPPDGRK